MAIDAARLTFAARTRADAAERAGLRPVIQKTHLRKKGNVVIFLLEHSRGVGLNEDLAVWTG